VIYKYSQSLRALRGLIGVMRGISKVASEGASSIYQTKDKKISVNNRSGLKIIREIRKMIRCFIKFTSLLKGTK